MKNDMKEGFYEMPLVLEVNGERIETTAQFWLRGAQLKKYKEKRARAWLEGVEEWAREHVSYRVEGCGNTWTRSGQY